MRYLAKGALILGMLVMGAAWALSRPGPAAKDEESSITIVFKDGHQQSFRLADIARIDFPAAAASASSLGRGHFIGQWKVGVGDGLETFLITLDRDGQARKNRDSGHGTWDVVGGEARITWDDGWRDVIRKVGNRYQKLAFEPGKSLSGKPSNVTDAVYTESNGTN